MKIVMTMMVLGLCLVGCGKEVEEANKPSAAEKGLMIQKTLAERGHANAQNNLGAVYASGIGVPKDAVAAYVWWHIAAVNGYAIAKESKSDIAKTMTAEQIAEAKKLVKKMLKENPQLLDR